MASSNKTSKNNKNETKVTRITAKDDMPVKKVVNKKNEDKSPSVVKTEKIVDHKKSTSFFGRIGQYFKASWNELRQVQWPNRKATWGLTLAVIIFTIFFAIVILLIDVVFQELFNIILSR